jgi:hypothetical protein
VRQKSPAARRFEYAEGKKCKKIAKKSCFVIIFHIEKLFCRAILIGWVFLSTTKPLLNRDVFAEEKRVWKPRKTHSD